MAAARLGALSSVGNLPPPSWQAKRVGRDCALVQCENRRVTVAAHVRALWAGRVARAEERAEDGDAFPKSHHARVVADVTIIRHVDSLLRHQRREEQDRVLRAPLLVGRPKGGLLLMDPPVIQPDHGAIARDERT